MGPSTLPFTTTLRALMAPLTSALGDTLIEVQFRSPAICPLPCTAPSELTLPMILNPFAITVLVRLDANIDLSYAAGSEQHRHAAKATRPRGLTPMGCKSLIASKDC